MTAHQNPELGAWQIENGKRGMVGGAQVLSVWFGEGKGSRIEGCMENELV